MHNKKMIFVPLALMLCAQALFARVPADPVSLEANHLLDCQTKSGAAAGAINDALPVNGGPDWVVPRENGTAILGLSEAFKATGNGNFKAGALAAADYLKRRQESDGAWCEQYNEKAGTIVNKNKSVSHAGSVIMAYYRVMQMGWEDGAHQYYDSAKKAAEYVLASIDNKPGAKNGLAGAGKEYGSYAQQDNLGGYQWNGWSWVSDNCYAYIALSRMREWAAAKGDTTFSENCGRHAAGVLNGINACLKNPGNAVWYRVVGSNGEQVSESDKIDALCYYPQKMDLPVPQRGSEAVARWIADNLQITSGTVSQGYGAFRWGNAFGASSERRSQGFALEAVLALIDIPGDVSQKARDLAKTWWESDDDTNGHGQLWDTANGGIVDWYGPTDNPPVAPSWQKFIDTSSNCIFVYRGGFDHLLTGSASAKPSVKIEGPVSAAKSTLSASWTFPGSGTTEYQYQITQDSPNGSVVTGWTSAGTDTRAVAGSLTLTPGKTYFWGVKAKDAAGQWSDAGYSDGIMYAPVSPDMPGAAYGDLRALEVYPNPYQPGRNDTPAGQGVVFDHLTNDADIKIFALTGEMVADLHGSGGRCLWDARTASGEKVASGVYAFLVTDPAGGKKEGKVAVLR